MLLGFLPQVTTLKAERAPGVTTHEDMAHGPSNSAAEQLEVQGSLHTITHRS
jgi:hypothetical protein